MDTISILRDLTVAAIPILVAITLHEVAHGWVASKLGDPTAKMMGRLTINPLAHIDLVGTIIIPIVLFIVSKGTFIFGSAKPIPVDYRNLRNPRRDSAIVAAAGPIANILISMASLFALLIIDKMLSDDVTKHNVVLLMIILPIMKMLRYSIFFNIFIAAFNLFPIPPLDGGRILLSLLPYRQAYLFSKLEPYGILIVLILWFSGIAQYIITPIKIFIFFIIGTFETFIMGIL